MNLVEADRALRKLRLSGMADVLETRLRQATRSTSHGLDPPWWPHLTRPRVAGFEVSPEG